MILRTVRIKLDRKDLILRPRLMILETSYFIICYKSELFLKWQISSKCSTTLGSTNKRPSCRKVSKTSLTTIKTTSKLRWLHSRLWDRCSRCNKCSKWWCGNSTKNKITTACSISMIVNKKVQTAPKKNASSVAAAKSPELWTPCRRSESAYSRSKVNLNSPWFSRRRAKVDKKSTRKRRKWKCLHFQPKASPLSFSCAKMTVLSTEIS